MKVLFLANIPAPYRVDFFNELGKSCDLTVSFEGQNATDRDKKWTHDPFTNFNAVFLKGIRTGADNFFCPEIIKLVKQKWDRIIVGVYSTPTSMLAIEYMRLKKIPFFIEADGGIIHENGGMKYAIKKHFISAAKGWLSSGKPTTKYLVHYGAREEYVQTYPFSSIWSKDIVEVSEEMKQQAKQALGASEKTMVLFVGRFIESKGIDVLLKVAAKLPEDVGIYLTGGEATEELLAQVSDSGAKVHFCGFKTKQELDTYYKAADLFYLPTRTDVWGLVINEAMAYALPIVTTDMCIAGVSMLTEEQIAKVDDVDEMLRKIQHLLSCGDEVGLQNQKLVRNYTIETMAQTHVRVLTEHGN